MGGGCLDKRKVGWTRAGQGGVSKGQKLENCIVL